MKRKMSDAEKERLKELRNICVESCFSIVFLLFFYCFSIVSKFIPSRKAKDARQVWKYHQRLDVKKAGFSVEE
jgi:hypothetical protein